MLLHVHSVLLIAGADCEQSDLLSFPYKTRLFVRLLRGVSTVCAENCLGSGNKRQVATRRTLQQHAGNEQAIDLIGTLEEPIDARIAVGSLNGIILVIAVAAMNLDSFVNHEIEHFRSVDFHH